MGASVWILADQLTPSHPGLAVAGEGSGRRPAILLVEPPFGGDSFPYHRKRQVLVASALRHYAAALRNEGYAVDCRRAPTAESAVVDHVREYRPGALVTMAASTYDTRRLQEGLNARLGIPVTVLPNTLFLSGESDPYPDADPGKRYVMAAFYRKMRKQYGILLDGDGKPDLLLGEPARNKGSTEAAGAVHVLAGSHRDKPLVLNKQGSPRMIRGLAAGEMFGSALSVMRGTGSSQYLLVGSPAAHRVVVLKCPLEGNTEHPTPLRAFMAPTGRREEFGASLAGGHLETAEKNHVAVGAPAASRIYVFHIH